jgi:hypothetical protein
VETFDGSEDALPWLTRVEQFFDRQGTRESGKVSCVLPSSTMVITMVPAFQGCTWRTAMGGVLYVVKSPFWAQIQNTELASIFFLRQTNSVDDYEELLNACEGLTEALQGAVWFSGYPLDGKG